jgi:hypothetical protein
MPVIVKRLFLALLAACLLAGMQPAPFFRRSPAHAAGTYYVATNGSDTTGTGSAERPWATIKRALRAPDGSLILVRPGTYTGQVLLQGDFPSGITIRSETPYMARLRYKGQVVIVVDPASGITLEGFDIAHSGTGSEVLVMHINGGNRIGLVENLTFRDNIFHDSYNNDIIKIDGSSSRITLEGNLFYNQEGSDEHIDINSAANIVVQDNIFMNDFPGSGRANRDDTGSFIMVKDSGAGNDELLGSRDITVRRNVFLNWQGMSSSGFVMVGEDGHNFFEAQRVMIENNLMLGNSSSNIISSMAVWGSKDVTFRSNTVIGDLPGNSFAMFLSKAGDNRPNENIRFYNNIWSDPTGSMGALRGTPYNDFSDTVPGRTASFAINNNLYWNGGRAIPAKSEDLINYTNDARRLVADPGLGSPGGVALPHWDPGTRRFGDGSRTIREAFVRLVEQYGAIPSSSPAVNAGNEAYAPAEDILGNPRRGAPDLGAYEGGNPLRVQLVAEDQALYLRWYADDSLPADATWDIAFDGPPGDVGSPILGLEGGTRSYWLRGLTNNYRYTVTVSAQANGETLYSASNNAFPTPHHISLPYIDR